MDQDAVEVHKFVKRERGQYPAILTEQARSIKDLLHCERIKCKPECINIPAVIKLFVRYKIVILVCNFSVKSCSFLSTFLDSEIRLLINNSYLVQTLHQKWNKMSTHDI